MEEMRRLYEEKKLSSLMKLCEKELAAGREDWEVYGYYGCAAAGRSSLAKACVGEGLLAFQKAVELCGDEDEKRKLCEAFAGEVIASGKRVQRERETVSMTKEVIGAYRECMRLSADALLGAIEAGNGAGADVLSMRKEAVSFMVRLCAVEQYEKDMGKYVIKGIDNAPEELRIRYTALYDGLVAEIKEQEPGYAPEEIQREYVEPRFKERTEEKPEEKPGDGKQGLWEQLTGFLKKGRGQ